MAKYLNVTKETKVIAQAGSCYVLTNNQDFDIDNITMNDLGCIVDVANKTMSPELPILVLTKCEPFYDVVDVPDLSDANNFEKIG